MSLSRGRLQLQANDRLPLLSTTSQSDGLSSLTNPDGDSRVRDSAAAPAAHHSRRGREPGPPCPRALKRKFAAMRGAVPQTALVRGLSHAKRAGRVRSEMVEVAGYGGGETILVSFTAEDARDPNLNLRHDPEWEALRVRAPAHCASWLDVYQAKPRCSLLGAPCCTTTINRCSRDRLGRFPSALFRLRGGLTRYRVRVSSGCG